MEEREILMEENKERLSGSDLFLCFIPVNARTTDRERPVFAPFYPLKVHRYGGVKKSDRLAI